MSQSEKFNCFVDIGCGNGRDSFFLAKLGVRVIGADYEHGVVENNNFLARKEGIFPAASFYKVDFSDLGSVYEFIEIVSSNSDATKPRCFYSRFFFHAIDVNTQASVFEFLKRTIKHGDVFACEFRVEGDSNGKKVTADHYRRYIRPLEFIRHAANYELECYYLVEGEGYANYKVDDARVARMLFKKAA